MKAVKTHHPKDGSIALLSDEQSSQDTVLTAFEELRGSILWAMNQRPDDCDLLEILFAIADRKLLQTRDATVQGVIQVKDELAVIHFPVCRWEGPHEPMPVPVPPVVIIYRQP